MDPNLLLQIIVGICIVGIGIPLGILLGVHIGMANAMLAIYNLWKGYNERRTASQVGNSEPADGDRSLGDAKPVFIHGKARKTRKV